MRTCIARTFSKNRSTTSSYRVLTVSLSSDMVIKSMTTCVQHQTEYIVDDSQHRNAPHVSTSTADLTAVEAEVASYKRAYFKNTQYIFSRAQQHAHKETKDGYVSLKYCAKHVHGKQARSAKPCNTCKQNFPYFGPIRIWRRIIAFQSRPCRTTMMLALAQSVRSPLVLPT